MAYPLLVPRHLLSKCLAHEYYLAPLAPMAAPSHEKLRGKFQDFFASPELFVTDDNDPELIEKLKSMRASPIVVGPIDWDNIVVWRREAIRRLPLHRWFLGARKASIGSVLLAGAIDGYMKGDMKTRLADAQMAGIIRRQQERGVPYYSVNSFYYKRHGE